MRNGPGLNYEASQTLPARTEVNVVGFDGSDQTWARIDLQGDGLVDGHVFAAFLKSENAQSDTGGPEEPEGDVD